jgi:hypothetical protein
MLEHGEAHCECHDVKYILLLLLLLAGCETSKPPRKVEYTKFSVTDATGDPVSEWIAEGKVHKTETGYDITAVERHSSPPYPTTTHYPNGRKATVAGPNIILETVEKPAWLRQLDGDKE